MKKSRDKLITISTTGRAYVEAKLLAALDSGEGSPVTATTWASCKQRIDERIRAARKRPRVYGPDS